jgi:dipeptidyl aminopeptidase/acylaminoacyl peptidase
MNGKKASTLHLAFERAAAFVPAKLVQRLSGVVVHGYWIDRCRYFYVVTKVDRAGGGFAQPMIADANTGTNAAAIEIDVLIQLLNAASQATSSRADLAAAEYDMPQATTLVVTVKQAAYWICLDRRLVLRIENVGGPPALHSPDGRRACVLKDHGVWVTDRRSGNTREILRGEPFNSYGHGLEAGPGAVAHRRSRLPNGLWSQDSQWFATHRIDERSLAETALMEYVPVGGGRPVMHRIKVAGPTDDVPLVEFVAVHIDSGRVLSASEYPAVPQAYSPFPLRQGWFTAEAFYYLRFNRSASQVELIELGLASGKARRVLEEATAAGWLELNPPTGGQPIVRVLTASNEVIWYSERDGYGHLYLYDLATGRLKNRITQGRWVVRDVVHVDEAGRRITFLANHEEGAVDPAHRRMCAIDFDGGGFQVLLEVDGDIAVQPDPVLGVRQDRAFSPSYAPSGVSQDGRFAIATIGAADRPTSTVLCDLASGRVIVLAAVSMEGAWTAPCPRPFEVTAADGVTKLHGVMFLPSDFDAGNSYPLVDYIYPGPQINWFTRRHPSGVGSVAQSVAELGMVAIIVESRGLPLRSRAFHQCTAGRLHEPQLMDHAAVISQLCERHAFIDRNRIGIFGQSGGGYATARALFDYPELFKVGVAVCGNHDNRNYFAHWLNKYGGPPRSDVLNEQSNLEAAGRLAGKLFLIHGDMDDNVHVAQTLSLANALIAAGKDFDQLLVPGAGHFMLQSDPYVIRRLWSFLARHLLGVEFPVGFKFEYSAEEAAAGTRFFMADFS